MTDIHDIKPVLHIAGPWIWWAAMVAALVLAAILAWWLYRRRGRVQAPEAHRQPSPQEQACALLEALGSEAIEGRAYYFRLSTILRRYIEQRFGIPAAEMTLEELLPCIERLPLPVDLARQLEMFCRAAEPIKFAAAPADPERMATDLIFARSFVQRTAATEKSKDESGGMLLEDER
jgi:hypothetical protein